MVQRDGCPGWLPIEQQSAISTQRFDYAMSSAVLCARPPLRPCAALLPAHQLLPKPPTIRAVL